MTDTVCEFGVDHWKILSGGLVESVTLVEFGRVAHACELPFGWMPDRRLPSWSYSASCGFMSFRTCSHMSVCTWRSEWWSGMGVGLEMGLRSRVRASVSRSRWFSSWLTVQFVGDLIPVVGQSAGGVDATEPVRVRGQPVDDREDERQGGRMVGVVGFGDPVDEVPDFGVVTFGRR